MNKVFLLLLSLFALTSCQTDKSAKVLKVAATPMPQAQMLDYIKPALLEQGIELKVVVMDDYNLPNRALSDKEVDANFFQHIPFLEEQIAQFHYDICVLAKVHIEPMGIYSKKIDHINQLQENALVAIPNDPTNEGRALLLLQEQGLITINGSKNLTPRNISSNPKKLRFQEVDAAILPRTLPDVAIAIIPTNFALQAHLSPSSDALALESKDSAYVNVIAVRCPDRDKPELIALKNVMTSKNMEEFILQRYKGAVIPAFDTNP